MRFRCPGCALDYEFPVEQIAGGVTVLRSRVCPVEFLIDRDGVRAADGTVLAAVDRAPAPVDEPPAAPPKHRYGGVGQYFFVRRGRRKGPATPTPAPAPDLPAFGAAVDVPQFAPLADVGGSPHSAAPSAPPSALVPVVLGALVLVGGLVFFLWPRAEVAPPRLASAPPPVVVDAAVLVDAAPAVDAAPRAEPRARALPSPSPRPAPRTARPLPPARPAAPPGDPEGKRFRAGSLYSSFNESYRAAGIKGRIRAVRCDQRPCIVFGEMPAGSDIDALMQGASLGVYGQDGRRVEVYEGPGGEVRFAAALYDATDAAQVENVTSNFDERAEAMWGLLDTPVAAEPDEDLEDTDDPLADDPFADDPEEDEALGAEPPESPE